MIRIGFIGDPHVGRAERWTNYDTALQLHKRLLEQQLDLCRQHKCSHVVMLGDLFDDPNPNQDKLAMVLEVFSGEKDLPIMCIAGNHDVQDAKVNSLRLLAKLPGAGALRNISFHIKPEVVKWEGFRILALPWGNPLPDDRVHLTVFHETALGCRRDNGTPSSKGMEEFNNLSIGGHIHTPQASGKYVYAGTAVQMSFGEDSSKRFLYVNMRKGEEPEVRSVPIERPVWRLKQIRYDSDDPPACDDPRTFYSLDISGDRPGPRWMVDHPRVVQMHGSNNKKVREATKTVVNLMEGQSSKGVDDRSLVLRWMKQYSNLNAFDRSMALRIHDRLSERNGS
jgi:DNA repair exonuclease SbcCD nuclease subunit